MLIPYTCLIISKQIWNFLNLATGSSFSTSPTLNTNCVIKYVTIFKYEKTLSKQNKCIYLILLDFQDFKFNFFINLKKIICQKIKFNLQCY